MMATIEIKDAGAKWLDFVKDILSVIISVNHANSVLVESV